MKGKPKEDLVLLERITKLKAEKIEIEIQESRFKEKSAEIKRMKAQYSIRS